MVLLASLSLSAAAGGHGRHLRSWKSKRKRHGGYGRVDMAMFARPEFLRWIADQPEVDYNAVRELRRVGWGGSRRRILYADCNKISFVHCT